MDPAIVDGKLISTVARLSFWVPPERMSEFETLYKEKLAPILEVHGLVESPMRGRPTIDEVFDRLFELKSPSELTEAREALDGDSAWQQVLRNLCVVFGTDSPDGLIRHALDMYTMPAGSGETVPAGPGKVCRTVEESGQWISNDVTDGLAGPGVASIFQDRDGYLWFGCDSEGVSRYDGMVYKNFTTRDGLAGNLVKSILQDRKGHLWFATDCGLSRYDGRHFRSFTTEGGKPSEASQDIESARRPPEQPGGVDLGGS